MAKKSLPPSGPLTEDQARKQVKKEREFYASLAAYLIVNAMLVTINLLTGGYFWAVWPLLGWGVGIASQAVAVFGMPGRGRAWEERRVRELMGEAGTAQRLRALVDEAVEERAGRRAPARLGAADDSAALRERIEHLEAIVTSRDWDLLDPADRAPEAEGGTDAQAARLARRVR